MLIFGVILAGGRGVRLGGVDKAFVAFRGRPLISHVLDRLSPQVERVLISANGDPMRFASFRCEVVADAQPQGPLSGVLAALSHATRQGATHLVSTPVDTPFLPCDLAPRLMLAAEGSAQGLAIAATADGNHPLSALWPVWLAPELAVFLAAGGAKVTDFTDAHEAARASFSDEHAFLNLNRPEDLVRAEAMLRSPE